MSYAKRIMIVGPADEVYRATKDPDETLDFVFDWSRLLGGDTVASSSWDSDGLTQPTASSVSGSDRTVVWLSGGDAGARYQVRNCITTAAGRVFYRTIILDVLPR